MQASDITSAIEMAKRGASVMCRCPAHDDGTASVHVSPGTDEPVVIKCHAGCETQAVLDAAGVDWGQVCHERSPVEQVTEWTPGGQASHVYSYTDTDGKELFQALRVPLLGGKKTFYQRHRKGDRWAWNIGGVQRVLYRLPAVVRAVATGQTVYIVEGEKDAEALVMDGFCGTCNPMGAGKWQDSYAEYLRGANVVVIADADGPGRDHARTVAESLARVNANVLTLESPIAKDYFDHRASGGVMESLIETARHVREDVRKRKYTLTEVLDTEFEQGREIIPGHLAAANVVLLVGAEGHGKSLFMRQMAVQCAAGINPFTSANMEPLRVLYIDAENPEAQQKMDWSVLDHIARRHRAGDSSWRDNLTVLMQWDAPVNILGPTGHAWLMGQIAECEPDLCLMGPLSDLMIGKLADDEVGQKVKRTIYEARSICQTAFVIEHHMPHRMAGDRKREARPYGSSVLMRFPDFGYGLVRGEEEGRYVLHPFRGARVKRRAWPEELRHGTPNSAEWPWEFSPDVGGSVTVGNFGGRA